MRLRKRGWAQLQTTSGVAAQSPVDLSDGGSRAAAVIQDDPEELHLRGTIWRLYLGVRDVTNDYEADRRKAQRVDAGSGRARTEAAVRGRGQRS